MDPPQVTDVQYGNAWIPLNQNKFGKTAMFHAGYAVTKKTCESCSIRHIHWKTKTKYSLNKTCCHQGQPVPKDQSSLFRYSMHEDSKGKKMDIVICGSGSIHVFCETRALEQFYNKSYKSTAQLQHISRNTTSLGHYRCSVYCEHELYLESVPPPSSSTFSEHFLLSSIPFLSFFLHSLVPCLWPHSFSYTNHKQKFLNLEEMFAVSWVYLVTLLFPVFSVACWPTGKREVASHKTWREVAMVRSWRKKGWKLLGP